MKTKKCNKHNSANKIRKMWNFGKLILASAVLVPISLCASRSTSVIKPTEPTQPQLVRQTEQVEKKVYHVITKQDTFKIIEPFTDTTETWNYEDTTMVVKKDVESLGILRKRDVPFFMDVLNLESPLKWMIIPVDGFYWDSAVTVADTVLSMVKEDIIVWFDDFEIKRIKGQHQTIGYIIVVNRNKPEPDAKTLEQEYEHIRNIIEIFDKEGIKKEEYNDLIDDVEHLKKLILAKGGKIPEKRQYRKKPVEPVSKASSKMITEPVPEEERIEDSVEIVEIDTSEIRLPSRYIDTPTYLAYPPIQCSLDKEALGEEFTKIKRRTEEEWIAPHLRVGLMYKDGLKTGSFDATVVLRPIILGAGIEGEIGKEALGFLKFNLGIVVGKARLKGIVIGRFIDTAKDTTIKRIVGNSKNMFLISETGGEFAYLFPITEDLGLNLSSAFFIDPAKPNMSYETGAEIVGEHIGFAIVLRTGNSRGYGLHLVFYP